MIDITGLRMRIILVEDDSLLGEGIATGLKQQNYNVEWFQQGKPALMSLEYETYDVMILDLGLPDISGIKLFRIYVIRAACYRC